MDRLNTVIGGNWFEQHVANQLQTRFPTSIVLHDLTLYSNYLTLLKTHKYNTQIDLVLICPFKIYIIEAKKWGYEIIGNRDDDYWTGKSNVRSFIQNINPVNQNIVHLRALKNLLRKNNYDLPEFESCICLPNGTTIDSDCKEVMELSTFLFKLDYDNLRFLEGKQVPLDTKYWASAISNVIRKQNKMR